MINPNGSYVATHGHALVDWSARLLLSCILTMVAADTTWADEPTVAQLIDETPKIDTAAEGAPSVSFVARMPSMALHPIELHASLIDGKQAIHAMSERGEPLLGFVDGTGWMYDCRGPQVNFTEGFYISLVGEATADRLNFNYGLSSRDNAKFQFDIPAILRLAKEQHVESLGDGRFRLEASSPSGNSVITAVYDRHRSPSLESFEIAITAEDGTRQHLFELRELKMGEAAQAVSVPMLTASDIPDGIRSEHVDSDSALTVALQLASLLKLVATRVGLEHPEIRDDPSYQTLVGRLNWDRMAAKDAEALELLRPKLLSTARPRVADGDGTPVR